jgi:hypothetical protein
MAEIIKYVKVDPGRKYTLRVRRNINGTLSNSVYPPIEISVPPGVMNIQSQQPIVTSKTINHKDPDTTIDPPAFNETVTYTTHHWGKQDNWATVKKKRVVYGVWVTYYTNQATNRVSVGQFVNVSETGEGTSGNAEWDGSRQVTAVGYSASRGSWYIQVYCAGSDGNDEPYNGQIAKIAATFTVDDPPYIVAGKSWTTQERTVYLPESTYNQLIRSDTVKDIPVILYKFGDSSSVSNEALKYMQDGSTFNPKVLPSFITPGSDYSKLSYTKDLPSGKSYKFYFTIIRYTKINGVWSGKWLAVKKPYTNLNELSISDIILSAEAVT